MTIIKNCIYLCILLQFQNSHIIKHTESKAKVVSAIFPHCCQTFGSNDITLHLLILFETGQDLDTIHHGNSVCKFKAPNARVSWSRKDYSLLSIVQQYSPRHYITVKGRVSEKFKMTFKVNAGKRYTSDWFIQDEIVF